MLAKIAGLLVALLFAVNAPMAHAVGIILEGITPSNPVVGQAIAARISQGWCDGVIYAAGYPQITSDGAHIRMVLETVHATSGMFCNFTPGTFSVPIGSFPPGTYALQVDRQYIDFFGHSVIEPVGNTRFAVAAAEPIPTVGAIGLFAMILCMVVVAAFVPRRSAPLARLDGRARLPMP